jgi:MoaA/NifB/PqqE/SkfB family radical SAM enzyme
MADFFENARRFNRNITSGFRDVLLANLGDPALGLFLLRLIRRYRAAERKRRAWAEKGVQVPPMLIYSVTQACNLNCKGCYARALHVSQKGELSSEAFAGLVDEAERIGISIIMLAGGEPLLRPELLDITRLHPRLIFPLFTNGLLLNNDEQLKKLKGQKHVIPILSLEGNALETNARRGMGVYENAWSIIGKLKQIHHFFGISITVDRGNFDLVTSAEYVAKMSALGSRIHFYVNYVPVTADTESQALTREQIDALPGILKVFRRRYAAMFVGFPSGEEEFGGCLAAGKGFVHISAQGEVQPCPFSPFADVNLRDMPLIEALQSPLLNKVRQGNEEGEESNGICGLWQKREWVESLSRKAT